MCIEKLLHPRKKKKEKKEKNAHSRARRVPYTVHRVKIWRHLDRIKLRKRWNSTNSDKGDKMSSRKKTGW